MTIATDNSDIKPMVPPEQTERLAKHGFGLTDEDIEATKNDKAFQTRRANAVNARHPDEEVVPDEST